MKRIALLLLMMTVLGPGSSCRSQADIEPTKYTFTIDNDDQSHFGYRTWEGDLDQTVASVCLYRDFAYLADSYHSNIKRIDLRSGRLVSSPHISSLQFAWLRDVAVIDSSVLVSCVVDSIYVLELNLEPRKTFPIEGRHQKFFWEVSEGILDVSIVINDRIVSVCKDSTIGSYRSAEDQWGWHSAHGKEYSEYEKNGRHFFECEYFTLELGGPLPRLWKAWYEAIDVDFDSTRLVCFHVDEKQFTLYVYDVPEENLKPRTEAADTMLREEQ